MKNLLPLLPLPNVVLFPGCFLPLHIFEARYRILITDIEAGSKMLVLALLKPGWEMQYHKSPAVCSTACAARLSAVERLADGRFNILLEGIDRVEILDELRNRPYRQAVVRAVAAGEDSEIFDRRRVLTLLSEILSFASVDVPEGLMDKLDQIQGNGLLADTIAHILQIPITEKQTILETPHVTQRLDRVLARLKEIRKKLE